MRSLKIVVSCLAVAAATSMATAQNERPKRPAGDQPTGERPPRGERPGRREPLTEEQSKAAWELEANSVSKRVGLDADKTKEVAKAYADARKSYDEAQRKTMEDMREKMRDADDRQKAMQDMRKAMEDMNKSEKEKFEKALSSNLSSDQVTKVTDSLGALGMGRQWDNMVHTVSEFKLDASKQETALNAIEDFVKANSKAPRPGPGADREEFQKVQKAMQENRDKLNESLKKVLSEEQYKKFEESTRLGGMRGMGGPGGPGGRRGGRGGDDNGG